MCLDSVRADLQHQLLDREEELSCALQDRERMKTKLQLCEVKIMLDVLHLICLAVALEIFDKCVSQVGTDLLHSADLACTVD